MHVDRKSRLRDQKRIDNRLYTMRTIEKSAHPGRGEYSQLGKAVRKAKKRSAHKKKI